MGFYRFLLAVQTEYLCVARRGPAQPSSSRIVVVLPAPSPELAEHLSFGHVQVEPGQGGHGAIALDRPSQWMASGPCTTSSKAQAGPPNPSPFGPVG